ncbi:hypothetical protein BLN97_39740 [Bradyrhizobium elkanii]|nr:hypothetical protein BLN97_39740 [Bradyrhizobium elkanii]
MRVADRGVEVDVVAVALGVECEHLVADAIERIEAGKPFRDVDPSGLIDQSTKYSIELLGQLDACKIAVLGS